MTDSQRKRDDDSYREMILEWTDHNPGLEIPPRTVYDSALAHCRETEVKEQRELYVRKRDQVIRFCKKKAVVEEQLRVAVEALEQVVKHEQDSLKYDSEIHKFNRYRENMYFKCLEALQKIEAMKGGGDE